MAGSKGGGAVGRWAEQEGMEHVAPSGGRANCEWDEDFVGVE
jgi:hypothetical protein